MVARTPQAGGMLTGREPRAEYPCFPPEGRKEQENEAAVVPVHEGEPRLDAPEREWTQPEQGPPGRREPWA